MAQGTLSKLHIRGVKSLKSFPWYSWVFWYSRGKCV